MLYSDCINCCTRLFKWEIQRHQSSATCTSESTTRGTWNVAWATVAASRLRCQYSHPKMTPAISFRRTVWAISAGVEPTDWALIDWQHSFPLVNVVLLKSSNRTGRHPTVEAMDR